MQPQLPSTADKLVKLDNEALLTPEEFRALVARLNCSIKRVKISHRVLLRTVFIIFGGSMIWRWWSNRAIFGSGLFCFMLVTEISLFLAWRSIGKKKTIAERLIRSVGNTNDAGLVGTMLDLHGTSTHLGSAWRTVDTSTLTALSRLLPLLQPADADTLNTQQRAFLRGTLFNHSSKGDRHGPFYCLDVLSALEQIGDKRDLPDVERLLKENAVPDEVRAAAERCAKVIWERAAREVGKDILLRPVTSATTTSDAELLRAASDDAVPFA